MLLAKVVGGFPQILPILVCSTSPEDRSLGPCTLPRRKSKELTRHQCRQSFIKTAQGNQVGEREEMGGSLREGGAGFLKGAKAGELCLDTRRQFFLAPGQCG